MDIFEKKLYSQMYNDSMDVSPMSDFSKLYLKHNPEFRFQQHDGLSPRAARYSK